nr:hypothetical transcript [Hymenolepis microstoma]CUU99076.1 hypothetical transcript [Hymenolepis microstoma]
MQIRGFLLDYESDIKLLAPYSPFVACALQVLPFVHAENAPTMHSAGIYDHYNERGKKMRLAIQDLPMEYNDFKVCVEYLSTELFNDPTDDYPEETLQIYKARFDKCLSFIQDHSSGVENALKGFFQLRKFIRRHLEMRFIHCSVSESDYFIDSDALSSSLGQPSDYDFV